MEFLPETSDGTSVDNPTEGMASYAAPHSGHDSALRYGAGPIR